MRKLCALRPVLCETTARPSGSEAEKNSSVAHRWSFQVQWGRCPQPRARRTRRQAGGLTGRTCAQKPGRGLEAQMSLIVDEVPERHWRTGAWRSRNSAAVERREQAAVVER